MQHKHKWQGHNSISKPTAFPTILQVLNNSKQTPAASQIVLACQKLRKANYTPIDFGEEINERQHQALVFPKYYNGKLTEVIDCAENERYKSANPCTVHRV